MKKIIPIISIIFITGCTTVNVTYPEPEDNTEQVEEQIEEQTPEQTFEDECIVDPSSPVCGNTEYEDITFEE